MNYSGSELVLCLAFYWPAVLKTALGVLKKRPFCLSSNLSDGLGRVSPEESKAKRAWAGHLGVALGRQHEMAKKINFSPVRNRFYPVCARLHKGSPTNFKYVIELGESFPTSPI